MRAPGPDHGILPAPGPDRQALRAPGRDEGYAEFPHRPVFAILLDLVTQGVGASSFLVVEVPWRVLATEGVGTSELVPSVSAAIELVTEGVGTSSLTVVRDEIELVTEGVGTSSFEMTFAAVTELATGATGTAEFDVLPAAVVVLSTSAAGTSSFESSASVAIPMATSGAGTAGFTISPRVAFTLATTGTGTHNAVVFAGYTYSDNFNRASLDGNWVAVGSTAPVISGSTKIQGGTSADVNTTTLYPARYTSAVAFDNHRSGGLLVAATGSQNTALGIGLWVRGTSSGDRVEAVVTPSSVTFFTRVGATSTQRGQQAGLSISTGSWADLVASGNVYTVYVDGSPVASWTDAGGAWTAGASNRYVGVTPLASRGFTTTINYGWALDDWVGRDG